MRLSGGTIWSNGMGGAVRSNRGMSRCSSGRSPKAGSIWAPCAGTACRTWRRGRDISTSGRRSLTSSTSCAASAHGEQAVANLWKIRGLADELVAQPGMTLAGFVELLKARLADPPDESESGLAEETSREAVRIMSIHKAKGLEFPIVVLVGVQAGTKPPAEPIQVQQDWSTGVLGLRLGDRCTLGGVYVAQTLEARLEAERRRLLYVRMTRAKERLVLSGALTQRQSPGNFLALLTEANACMTKTAIPAGVGKPARGERKKKDAAPLRGLEDFETRWRAREGRWERCRQRSLYVT